MKHQIRAALEPPILGVRGTTYGYYLNVKAASIDLWQAWWFTVTYYL